MDGKTTDEIMADLAIVVAVWALEGKSDAEMYAAILLKEREIKVNPLKRKYELIS